MIKNILKVVKQSKVVILVIIGVLTALSMMLSSAEEVVESIPVVEDSLMVDSLVVITLTHDSI